MEKSSARLRGEAGRERRRGLAEGDGAAERQLIGKPGTVGDKGDRSGDDLAAGEMEVRRTGKRDGGEDQLQAIDGGDDERQVDRARRGIGRARSAKPP